MTIIIDSDDNDHYDTTPPAIIGNTKRQQQQQEQQQQQQPDVNEDDDPNNDDGIDDDDNDDTENNEIALVPSIGPEPLLISHKQIDALYHLLQVVITAINQCYVTIPSSYNNHNYNNINNQEGDDEHDEQTTTTTTTTTTTNNRSPILYTITGGTLLGAIRQQSILFTDDDIDIAIIEQTGYCYQSIREQLPNILQKISYNKSNHHEKDIYQYTINAWDGSDRIRYKKCSNVFIDIFCIRQYNTIYELRTILQSKQQYHHHRNYKQQQYTNNANEQEQQQLYQSKDYVESIIYKIQQALTTPSPVMMMKDHNNNNNDNNNDTLLSSDNNNNNNNMKEIQFPIWHFDRRKAIELWPKEVYTTYELFPILKYNFGPILQQISGPNMPLTILYRCFGNDCFITYYKQIHSHHNKMNNYKNDNEKYNHNNDNNTDNNNSNNDADNNDNNNNNNDYNDTNIDTENAIATTATIATTKNLPPHIPKNCGGRWEGTTGYTLLPEHYIPIQPTLRQLRKYNNHNYETLQQYIKEQSYIEQKQIIYQQQLQKEQQQEQVQLLKRPRRTIYMDGIFDLFHVGHIHAIEQCVKLGDYIIIGVVSDDDAKDYKRLPIIHEKDRIKIIQSMKYVNQVICPCPLIITKEFIQLYNIDLIVHGFANEQDQFQQYEFFKIPIELNQFQQIDYYHELSTTMIINKIQKLYQIQLQQEEEQQQEQLNDDHNNDIHDTNNDQKNDNDTKNRNSNCSINKSAIAPSSSSSSSSNQFGTTVVSITNNNTYIPYDPFPLQLRIAIESHINKARNKQNNEFERIYQYLKMTKTELLQMIHNSSPLATESTFHYNIQSYPLRGAFLQCCGHPNTTSNLVHDLTRLHEDINNKDNMLQYLTEHYEPFQQLFDQFVRYVCIPRMVHNSKDDTINNETTFYYQAFPCIRIVQPNEFSIGPHSDITYGHHAGSINIYVPLTCIDGTASLFLESRYGSEDWHPIIGDYGMVHHFAGASCLHWTTNNTTNYTRVSLDFRIIAGMIYNTLSNSGEMYRNSFYSSCEKQNDHWVRINEHIPPPDKRTGFPWTVNDWDKYRKKTKR